MNEPVDHLDLNQPTTVSIVVPVYAGAHYLRRIVDEVSALRESWKTNRAPLVLSELIFVDDAAMDGSSELIDNLARLYDWVVPIHLSRNFGQHGATTAGILYSVGDWVATIDEDLQHPPRNISIMLQHTVEQGADIAYARPTKAVHNAKVRDWSSLGFKRLMQWITGNPNLRYFNSFRLLRGDIARSSASVAMHDTYLDMNLTWFTDRIIGVPMELRDERFIQTGKSGYQIKKLVAHAWRMLFSSHLKVLQVSTIFGLLTIVTSLLIAAAIILIKIFAPSWISVQGWASIAIIVSLLGGATMIMLGIALQYLSTLVLRAHGKPTFFVIDRSRDEELVRYFRAQK